MNSDEQEIRQLVTTWIDGTKSGDTDTVLGLMSDDVVFLVTGQLPMIGKAAFAAAMRAQSGHGRPKFEGKSEIQEIQVLGDWAYMWTKLTIVFTPPGSASPVTRGKHADDSQETEWQMGTRSRCKYAFGSTTEIIKTVAAEILTVRECHLEHRPDIGIVLILIPAAVV